MIAAGGSQRTVVENETVLKNRPLAPACGCQGRSSVSSLLSISNCDWNVVDFNHHQQQVFSRTVDGAGPTDRVYNLSDTFAGMENMARCITISCGNASQDFELPKHAIQEINLLFRILPAETAVLFDGDENARRIPANIVAEACKKMLTSIEKGELVLGEIYYFQVHRPETPPIRVNGGMNTTINGVPHQFDVGLGLCNLIRMELNQAGEYIASDPIDLRGQSSVQTDFGLVKIKRRKTVDGVPPVLRAILKFAASRSNDICSVQTD